MIKNHEIPKISVIGLSMLLSTILGVSCIILEHYIHELGHMLAGFIYNLFRGKFEMPTISNYKWFRFIPILQQTSAPKSTFVALSGPAMSILFYAYLLIYIYTKLHMELRIQKKDLIYPLIAITFFEITENVIFGTDNCKGKPLLPENEIIDLITSNIVLIYMISLFPISMRISKYIFKKIQTRWK